jgi:hypothetical protein
LTTITVVCNEMADNKKPIANSRVYRIAGAATADPRTVKKVLDGRTVRGSVAVRIREAIERDGAK